jgi:hypothetical protein
MTLSDNSQTQHTARRRQKALAVFRGNNPGVKEQGPGGQTLDQSTYLVRRLGNTQSNNQLPSGAVVVDGPCGCTIGGGGGGDIGGGGGDFP